MANGREDMIEKNRGRVKPHKDERYHSWVSRLGREDAQMLLEKSTGRRRKLSKRDFEI